MNIGHMLASAGRNMTQGGGLFGSQGMGGLAGVGSGALGAGGGLGGIGGGLFGAGLTKLLGGHGGGDGDGDEASPIGAPGTPSAAAAQPGTGGLFSAAGASTHPGMSMANVPTLTPDETKKLGFFGKLNAVDASTGMSTTDKVGRFGAELGDIWGDGDGSAAKGYNDQAAAWLAKRKTSAASEAMNAQIDAMFGDDPRMRFLLKANPEKATEALLKAREPLKLGGDERLMGADGREIAGQAPKYGVHNDAVFDERSGDFTGRAPQSYGDITARRRLDEYEIPRGERQDATADFNAQTGRMNAGTGAFAAHSADWGRRNPQGRGGGAAPGGAGGVSTDALLRALRGF